LGKQKPGKNLVHPLVKDFTLLIQNGFGKSPKEVGGNLTWRQITLFTDAVAQSHRADIADLLNIIALGAQGSSKSINRAAGDLRRG
jgi:hypothetical protein